MSSLQRYQRNILLSSINEEGQKKLNNCKVLVAGAGGLGSSVTSNLACIGVETIGIIDFDVVETSNLNRQFIHKNNSISTPKTESAKKWINEFNPQIKVTTYNKKLEDNTELINYDIVIDCFDNWESKFLLNKLCIRNNIPLIHAGVEEYKGQVITIIPDKSACLECILNPNQTVNINRGITSPIINIIGSIASNEVINFVLNKHKLLTNTILSYDISENSLKKLRIIKKPDCTICSKNNQRKY